MTTKSWRDEVMVRLSDYYDADEIVEALAPIVDAKDALIAELEKKVLVLTFEIEAEKVLNVTDEEIHAEAYQEGATDARGVMSETIRVLRERDEALARIAELEEIPESVRHSEMVNGLEAVIRGLEARAEKAESQLADRARYDDDVRAAALVCESLGSERGRVLLSAPYWKGGK